MIFGLNPRHIKWLVQWNTISAVVKGIQGKVGRDSAGFAERLPGY